MGNVWGMYLRALVQCKRGGFKYARRVVRLKKGTLGKWRFKDARTERKRGIMSCGWCGVVLTRFGTSGFSG